MMKEGRESSPGGRSPGRELRLEGISVRLDGKPILNELEALFPPARVTAIVGPNGAGKSTLLRAILGVVPLSAGRVLLGERSVKDLDPRELARSIALVPQDTHMDFSFRVEEVVLMGRYPHLGPLERERPRDRRLMEETLGVLDLLPLRGRDVTTLSEGECQRVLIARSLATEAGVLLLDEPISHLDIAHRLRILDLLRETARRGCTVVAVLHDLDLAARHADRLLVLDGGERAGEGDPRTILETGILERVFDVRVEQVQGSRGSFLAFTRRDETAGAG